MLAIQTWAYKLHVELADVGVNAWVALSCEKMRCVLDAFVGLWVWQKIRLGASLVLIALHLNATLTSTAMHCSHAVALVNIAWVFAEVVWLVDATHAGQRVTFASPGLCTIHSHQLCHVACGETNSLAQATIMGSMVQYFN
jgi:hypothetical protein